MEDSKKVEGMLSSYWVLDLTDEKGLALWQTPWRPWGSDVIKIEKPGEYPSRNVGPFYSDRRVRTRTRRLLIL